jgi:hypothetical protein
MPESSNSPKTSSDRASEMGHHDPAAQLVEKQPGRRRLRSWLSGIPPMALRALFAALAAALVGAVFGGKAIYVNVIAPSDPTKPTSTVQTNPTSSTPTTPTAPVAEGSSGTTDYLDAAGPTEISSSSAEAEEDFGTGLATIDGTAFPHSIRQIYSSCCSNVRSETFSVPEGFTHFLASIGLETGGTYEAADSPSIIFEVDTGSASHRESQSTMVYKEHAENIEVSVVGQTQIVLHTTVANPKVCSYNEVCHADAVWGNARFTK